MLPRKSRWSARRKSRWKPGGARSGFRKLRELALVLAADVVDFQLKDYLEHHGIQQHFGAHERILVCITPRANVEEMLEEARIVAERFHGDLIVAYVKQPASRRRTNPRSTRKLSAGAGGRRAHRDSGRRRSRRGASASTPGLTA